MADEDPQDNLGEIKTSILEEEMQSSYLDYAMSVIVSRALPDARDGLKPVHRRILYAMDGLSLNSSGRHKKSAAVVGDVLGKYHPHGERAIYDSLVRFAQNFSMRYPLVDGQGNFGSIDGDEAAAMRYTESKMTDISEEILADIGKDTVDFVDNYDGTKQEPVVLPSKVPNLLMNGGIGIAVGMATSIPPHNLTELLDATIALVDDPEMTVEDLMEYIKGPDFPTGGVIFDKEEIQKTYATGKGSIVMRAIAEIVGDEDEGFQIVVTELPYTVNKSDLLEKIAGLVNDDKIKGIRDIRDESDREGIRVVIELKDKAFPKKVLNKLFKMSRMQKTFHVNLIALVDGLQPRVLDLKAALEHFIEHRKEVIRRRTEYELQQAEDREHILAGLRTALDRLDEVITTIRESETKEEAHEELTEDYDLSDEQADAILQMRLQTLAGLERQKIEDEHEEKKELIKELQKILDDEEEILEIIKEESEEMKEKYGDPRRTQVRPGPAGEFTDKDLIPNEDVVITMTESGYVKRQRVGAYRTQRRGGKGVIGMNMKDEDVLKNIQVANNHDDILFFTNQGRVFQQSAFEIPRASRTAKGTPIVNVINLAPEEEVTGWLAMSDYDPDHYFLFVTKNGTVKKTAVEKFENIRSSGLIAVKLEEGDEVRFVGETAEGNHVMLITEEGQSIRFDQEDVRAMGRAAKGVRGIRLREGDQVVDAQIVDPDQGMNLMVVSEKGLGKQTPLEEYSVQNRGGIGVKTMNVSDKTGKVAGAHLLPMDDDWEGEIFMTSKDGQVIRMSTDDVTTQGRTTQGVKMMNLSDGDEVASLTVFSKDAEEEITEQAKELEE